MVSIHVWKSKDKNNPQDFFTSSLLTWYRHFCPVPQRLRLSMFQICIWFTIVEWQRGNDIFFKTKILDFSYLELFELHHMTFQKSLENGQNYVTGYYRIGSRIRFCFLTYQSTRQEACNGYDDTEKKLRVMALKAIPNTDTDRITIFLEQQLLWCSISANIGNTKLLSITSNDILF